MKRFSASLCGCLLASALHAAFFYWDVADIAFLAIVVSGVPITWCVVVLLPSKQLARAFWLGAAIGGGPSLLGCALLLVQVKKKLPLPNGRIISLLNMSGLITVALLIMGFASIDIRAYWANQPLTNINSSKSLPPSAPNVILISIDSWRADTLFGYDELFPNIAALRNMSLWSDKTLVAAPSAIPSHLAMLTGDYPLRNGRRQADGIYRTKDSLATPTIFRVFHEAGWKTISLIWDTIKFDKSEVADGLDVYENYAQDNPRLLLLQSPSVPSWLRFMPQPYRQGMMQQLFGWRTKGYAGDIKELVIGDAPSKVTLRRSMGYLKSFSNDTQPFFMFLHFVDLHQPYLSDESVRGTLTKELSWPKGYVDLPTHDRDVAKMISHDLVSGLPEALTAAEYLHKIYLEELMQIDKYLGEIFSAVNDIDRPTYLLLTSDHGEHFGEHGQMAHAKSLYKDVLRVPLLLTGPTIQRTELLNVTLEDVLPTLTEAAQINTPNNISGRSLLRSRPPQDYLATSRTGFALFHGKWKLVVEHGGELYDSDKWQVLRLCDLSSDPDEWVDLSGEHAELVLKMLDLASSIIRS